MIARKYRTADVIMLVWLKEICKTLGEKASFQGGGLIKYLDEYLYEKYL